MTKKKTYAVFFTLLAIGIAFCIGGIWIGEALYIAGAAFIAGALGMCSQTQAFTAADTQPSTSSPPRPLMLENSNDDIEACRHPHRPHHTQTILFSRQISGQDSEGHHYRQVFKLKEEIEDEHKSDETSYHTAPDPLLIDNEKLTNI